MKKLISIVCVLGISACAANKPSRIDAQTENIYKEKTQLFCNIRFGNLKNFCACVAENISTITPDELKIRAVKGDSSAGKEVDALIESHKDKLMACEKKKADDFSSSEIRVPDLAKKYVEKHKDQLMTPENRLHLKPELPIGYQFKMVVVGKESSAGYIHRLTKKEGGYLYFSTLESTGEIFQPDFYRYKDGIKSIHNAKEPGKVYKTNSEEICKVTLGECMYTNVLNQSKFMSTEFKDGVWISNQPGYGGRDTVFRIYSNDGLLLYEHSLFANKREITRVRKKR